jgi:hypothetical protein
MAPGERIRQSGGKNFRACKCGAFYSTGLMYAIDVMDFVSNRGLFLAK